MFPFHTELLLERAPFSVCAVISRHITEMKQLLVMSALPSTLLVLTALSVCSVYLLI